VIFSHMKIFHPVPLMQLSDPQNWEDDLQGTTGQVLRNSNQPHQQWSILRS
jgi:hypothetical protein